jgi:hypothetical protein
MYVKIPASSSGTIKLLTSFGKKSIKLHTIISDMGSRSSLSAVARLWGR